MRCACVIAAILLTTCGAATASVFTVTSVNDLTPTGPLATSPSSHLTRYVTSTGTAANFELWYTDGQGSLPAYYVTGSYDGSSVTLSSPAAVTLDDNGLGWTTDTYAGYHLEVIKEGSTYHMINFRHEYLTGTTPTSFTKQGVISYSPSLTDPGPPATNGSEDYGVAGFMEDGGAYRVIQDTNFGRLFPASTTDLAGMAWDQHGWAFHNSLPENGGAIQQPTATPGTANDPTYRLSPSGDLLKLDGSYLLFVPDNEDAGLGLVDLGTDITQGIANQDWIYDPNGDTLTPPSPILGTSGNPGLGGTNTRDDFREATLLPTANPGEFLVIYTASWPGDSKQLGAAVIQLTSGEIPEPTSLLLLLGAAVSGLLLTRRRRK